MFKVDENKTKESFVEILMGHLFLILESSPVQICHVLINIFVKLCWVDLVN